MTRQWRPGWIILAVMLIGFTALVFVYWPKTPLWTMPLETVLGFDESKGLLYTIDFRVDHYELRGYDLHSGSRCQIVALRPVASDESSNTVIVGSAREERMKEFAAGWKWMLSPNKQILVAANWFQDNLQLLALESGQPIRQINRSDSMWHLLEAKFGFSNDSSFLGVQDLSDEIAVWDLRTGNLIDHLDPRVALNGMFEFQLIPNHLHIDAQRRYLTYSDRKQCIVRDITTKKEVFHHEGRGMPRFIGDGNTVVFTPQHIRADNRPVWHCRQENGSWEKLALDLNDKGDIGDFVCCGNDLLVTSNAEPVELQFVKWLPDSLRDWAIQHFPVNGARFRLCFWDLSTGALRQACTLFEPRAFNKALINFSPPPAGYVFDPDIEKRVMVSESGKWLAHTFDNKISLWQLSFHRPWLCWVVVLSAVLLAMWLAWPRRVKMP